jgi:uncharacterized cupredoxin-like copper-binding protein
LDFASGIVALIGKIHDQPLALRFAGEKGEARHVAACNLIHMFDAGGRVIRSSGTRPLMFVRYLQAGPGHASEQRAVATSSGPKKGCSGILQGFPQMPEMKIRISRSSSALKAGLLFAITLVLAACSSGGNGSTNVTVTLNDYTITPSITTFQTGVPYHFVITNDGAVEHEFEIMPPDSSQLTTEQVDSMRLAGIDSITPGQTVTLDYTFTKAAPEGTLEFACHFPGHYDAGMHTSIVVK